MRQTVLSAAFAIGAAIVTTAALAQAPDVVRVRGTIQSVDGSMPVSYTHLDVYKRQQLRRQ